MRFHVSHVTRYVYASPASESFAELRVWPQDNEHQRVLKRSIRVAPEAEIEHYTDFYGNKVEFFSIPFRHNELTVESRAEVETFPSTIPDEVLATPLAEARQLYNTRLFRLFEFLQPTALTPFAPVAHVERERFYESVPLGTLLPGLNEWIYRNFVYSPGSTDVSTPLQKVVRGRRGVCQDFAHLMLALLRHHGVPARYVSGYIEAYDPESSDPGLIGAAASHAWVEVFLPGGRWWGLDPTNNKAAGERHVKVAVGRDYSDVAPMRGTFKGATDQQLQVMVSLKRGATEPTPHLQPA